MFLRRLTLLLLGLALSALAPLAMAQNWPTKPVRIVLQFPPGGATDAVARVLASQLSTTLGQPVIVENRPGADGAIAAEHVIRSEPDGHTFFLASNTPMMQVPLLRKNPPYDPLRSFTPVSMVGNYIYVLVVNPSVPAKDARELLALARSQPGKLGYGSYSGVTQLMHTRFKSVSKVDFAFVPYKGEGPTVTDLLGNHIQLSYTTPVSTMQHIREGKLRVLATLLPNRFSLLPNVPTAAEAGLPTLNAGTWAVLMGPPKLPPEITARMNREFNAVLRKPEVREQIEKLGFDLAGSTPDELAGFLREQLVAWAAAFKEAGLNPE